MNLYEAIFVRKTVRKYKMDTLEQLKLDGIIRFAESLPMLYPSNSVEYKLYEYEKVKQHLSGALSVKAPYYLALYAINEPGYLINAGYLMQQISLYLTAKGLGSCYLGLLKPKKHTMEDNKYEYIITLAFGESEHEIYRTSEKAKRHPMEDLVVYKTEVGNNIKTMIKAARLSPSSLNSQPWRFVVNDNRIHIFCKKAMTISSILNDMKMIDIGICIAHLLVTAEELWVDVKVKHYDNISNITFKKNEYVLSVKMV